MRASGAIPTINGLTLRQVIVGGSCEKTVTVAADDALDVAMLQSALGTLCDKCSDDDVPIINVEEQTLHRVGFVSGDLRVS